ncbi:MAG TPA: cytochrome c biogenesis protein CcdA [Anaerolineae bacterium]|nr:cytochrome c biogenesis protein CcdA [Anaerolineae bacterium]MCB9103522.1 cytochrome c biogenesis protein CcdA [Anaerolineales bacterium]HRV94703.1 cytochrome c biogenesis protein CcdA [Anaerolineae bacterium]
MGFENITIFAAFFAGLLSFISPCVLPLIPVYLGYLSGSTLTGDEPPPRQVVFSHALMFVAGFTFIFVVVFGVPAGFLGGALGALTDYLVWIGGLLLIVFGLHVMHIINIPIFNVQKKMDYGQGQAPSYVRSAIIGMAFAAGWTPCIGPLLGAILTLAIQGQNVGLAMFYLFVYSMGLAIPFLVTAWMLTAATSRLKRLNHFLPIIERVSGAFIIIVGVLLVTGYFTILNTFFNGIAPAWLLELS